jgi:hypothetical protein
MDFIRVAILTCVLMLLGCGAAPAETCTPGLSVACIGPAGCSGGQVCDKDGTGYLACQCAPADSGAGGGTAAGGGTGGGSGGGSTNPCEGITCPTPPAPICLTATSARTWSPSGTCSGGTCSYVFTDSACPTGCSGGVCNPNPCGGITCSTPPAPTCASASTRRAYSSTGTCSNGTCSYTFTDSTCPYGCAGGTCNANPCTTTTCNSPPGASCTTPSTRRVYSSPGTCTGGACSYSFTETTCPYGCAGGVCKPDPCASITCTALSQCHLVGTCNSATGTCSNPLKAAGSSCDDGNLCTLSDTCNSSGVCVGGTTKTCPAVDAGVGFCQVGACVPSTGLCGSMPGPDNTVCVADLQNRLGMCRSGICRLGVLGAMCGTTSVPCSEGTCDDGRVGNPDGTNGYCVPCGAAGQLCCRYRVYSGYNVAASNCWEAQKDYCCNVGATCTGPGGNNPIGMCQ